MMKSKMLIAGMGVAVFFASCTKNEKAGESVGAGADSIAVVHPAPSDSITKATPTAPGDTSENALDWAGTYTATVPCADCPGIKTSLLLNDDKTFSVTEEYIDRNSKNQDMGTFSWDNTGSMITLHGKTANYQYKVGENMLIQLDREGKEIEGPDKDLYIFRKK
ncbi:copper resistance protein NlpE [Chryseobacterium sp. JK1]|uniref:copper resistance protein NlpE n=1 Tax=Chryseobacterium sp. JK1 TaxID=874294 RepID=UPI003D6882DA